MLVILFVTLLAALTLATFSVSTAHADEVGTEFDFTISGNVQFDGEALGDVAIAVSGNGYEADTVTDADGRWAIGVPEKSTYDVTLDEDTLPEGVVVTEGGNVLETAFGLTDRRSVNFFLGEGIRDTASFFDQFVNRFFNGLNFGLLLALAAIGVSLIFGTTGLSNFAHAELITFGALMTLVFSVNFGLPIWLAILILSLIHI